MKLRNSSCCARFCMVEVEGCPFGHRSTSSSSHNVLFHIPVTYPKRPMTVLRYENEDIPSRSCNSR